MEERFGHDFRAIRIHTDTLAARAAAAVDARAFTVGHHIAFGAGQYRPGAAEGERLLAHELVHTLQQGSGPPVLQGAWQSLGAFAWDHHVVHDQRVVLDVRVGSESDWASELRDLDDEEEVWQVKGFTETAWDPTDVGAAQPQNPARRRNFTNTVTRAPNAAEILAFLRAFYAVGEPLDLPSHTFEATGILRTSLRADVSKIIELHQGLLLRDLATRGETLSPEGIAAIRDQAGPRPIPAMIQNAGATAMKSIDLIATARSGNDANALSDAQATIRLAGRTIRYALSAHAAAVAFDQAVTDTIFDTVWSTIPGGGAIASAGQELLKAGLKAMLTGATSRSDPAQQSQKILDEFIRSVRAARRDGHFGPGEAGVSIESDAITGFEAAMR